MCWGFVKTFTYIADAHLQYVIWRVGCYVYAVAVMLPNL
jgi:hypothetical protein